MVEEDSRREAAARAAQARLSSTATAAQSDNTEAVRKHKLKIKKHINDITGQLRYEAASNCLQVGAKRPLCICP